jgi:hypothetical protein
LLTGRSFCLGEFLKKDILKIGDSKNICAKVLDILKEEGRGGGGRRRSRRRRRRRREEGEAGRGGRGGREGREGGWRRRRQEQGRAKGEAGTQWRATNNLVRELTQQIVVRKQCWAEGISSPKVNLAKHGDERVSPPKSISQSSQTWTSQPSSRSSVGDRI